MKKGLKNNKNNKSGYIFLSVVFMTVVLEAALGATAMRQIQEKRLVEFNRMKLETFYAAQGAIEQAIQNLAVSTANFELGTFLADAADGINVPYSDGQTVANYTITLGTGPYTVDENGITKGVQEYVITGQAAHPDNANFMLAMPANSSINQIVSIKTSTLYQFMAFYGDDLEILPGGNMTLTGKVHTNGDLYLGTHATFTIDTEYVRSVGDVFRTRKDDGSLTYGTVNIKVAGGGGWATMTTSPLLDSTNPNWPTISQSTWNGTVQDRNQGVQVITPLGIPPITPGGFYDTTADFRVVGNQAFDGNGNNITSLLPANTITTSTFRDAREGVNVTVTNIDINLLRGSAYYPSNGVIYATRSDAVQGQPNGFRLINGSTVGPSSGGPSGLTVVTNNPLYVKGDFNNVNKKPVALIADSLNILSNSWNDANSTLSLNNRVASNTTVNAAFTAGIETTTPGQYNGGLENYPRLLEKWTGKTLAITGAFVSVWESMIASGNWSYGNYYTAPTRTWTYDSTFINNPPPFTPVVVETEKLGWWQEGKESLSV